MCLKQLQFLLVVPIHGDLHPKMSDGFRQTVLWNFMCSSIYLTNMPSGCSVVTSDALPYLSNIHLKCAHLHFGGFSDPLWIQLGCLARAVGLFVHLVREGCGYGQWSLLLDSHHPHSHPGLGVLVLFGLDCRFPMV